MTRFSSDPCLSFSFLYHPGTFNLIKNIVHCRSSGCYDYIFFLEDLFIFPGLKPTHRLFICMVCAVPAVNVSSQTRQSLDRWIFPNGDLNSHLGLVHQLHSQDILLLSILAGGEWGSNRLSFIGGMCITMPSLGLVPCREAA